MLKLPTENTLDREEKIMVEWIDILLSDILMDKGYIRGPFGSALKRGDMKEDGIPVYEQQHAIYNSRDFRYYIDEQKFNEMKRFQVKKDDLIISCSGTVGKVSIIKDDDPKGIISQALLLLRADTNKVLPLYLKYFFSSREGYNAIVSRSSGSVQVNIAKRSVIEQIPLKLPQIKTQRKIVGVLSSIDEKIEENERINNNLKQQVSILYQSWFEDFEITNGVCPEDWSYQELSSIADIASGKRPPVKSNVCNQETPISIVGAASVMGFTSEANHTDKILVTGRVGTHGVVQRFNTPCWTSDNTLVITSPYYEFTNQILHRIDYSSMNRGSTQPLITQGDMKKVVVLVPDENTLAKFEEFAGSLMVKWEANNKENVKLASLRDTLLPKLMSGELDVSDIEL